MRSFLSLLVAVAALSLTPVRAWAEAGHSHCEEPAAAPATTPATASVAPTELSAPAGPCGECPGSSCAAHRHCAAGTPPVVLEPSLVELAFEPDAGSGLVAAAGFVMSFDPTPPTPPPNLRTR